MDRDIRLTRLFINESRWAFPNEPDNAKGAVSFRQGDREDDAEFEFVSRGGYGVVDVRAPKRQPEVGSLAFTARVKAFLLKALANHGRLVGVPPGTSIVYDDVRIEIDEHEPAARFTV